MSSNRQDWVEWHRAYDDPASRLSQRLRVVQEHVRRSIDERPGRMRLVSMCAGEGRDVIPVLADHARRSDVDARLVELDPRLAAMARAAASAAGLERVEVVEADAAATDSYAGAVPADIVLACGVFGNVTDDDVRLTISHLPELCVRGATVIWTRGCEKDRDIGSMIRGWFDESGFEETAFDAPEALRFQVGVHRLAAAPRALTRGVTMFRFFR